MTEPTGAGADALAGTAASLSARQATSEEADRELLAALQDAHAKTTRAINRLEDIDAEIEAAVQNHATLALDTAAGAREMQRWLLAKHHEIIDIVSDARGDAAAKRALVESLSNQYSGIGGASD